MNKNAKQEFLKHTEGLQPIYVRILVEFRRGRKVLEGKPDDILEQLDFEYYAGFGTQCLYGNIWYADGSWSERAEYDGSEWWEHKVCPTLPEGFED